MSGCWLILDENDRCVATAWHFDRIDEEIRKACLRFPSRKFHARLAHTIGRPEPLP